MRIGRARIANPCERGKIFNIMKNYPIYAPPESLALKGSKNWNKKESIEYFNWFIQIMDERISSFLSYIDYRLTGKIKSDLQEISLKVFNIVSLPQFYSIRDIDGVKVLNKHGLSIAADMGLCLGKLVKNENPNIQWSIGKGPKSYHSYNLPVLREFEGTTSEFDCVFFLIVKLGVSINIKKKPYDLNEIYSNLLKDVKQ